MSDDFNPFNFSMDEGLGEFDETFNNNSLNFNDFSFEDDQFTDSTSSVSFDSNRFLSDPFPPFIHQKNFQSAMPSPLEIPQIPVNPFSSSQLVKRFISGGQRNLLNKNNFNALSPSPSSKTLLPAKMDITAMETFHPRSKKSRPTEIWVSVSPNAIKTDKFFNDLLLNRSSIINPSQLHFIPSYFWPNKDFSFSDIVIDFFRRKNNVNCRFFHKLYNAVQISQISDIYSEIVGLKFITNEVLKVSKGSFARLLGIKSVDGGLFHKQGNFPTHGFIEISADQAMVYCEGVDLSDVDYDEIRLLVHSDGIFTKFCSETQIFELYNNRCKR